ncbi:MAG: TonB-dependent receptor [Sphingobacterium sp.]|jgi:TonB-linked SusC/RagA family outer membrane protein|nr:TonB-dependent receptor [Sphingobacterium sp.]
MKVNNYCRGLEKYRHFQQRKKLKLTATFVCSLLLYANSNVFGQSISYSKPNVPLAEFFKVVKSQTDYNVITEGTLIRGKLVRNVDLKNVKLEEALAQVLFPLDLDFVVKKKSIIITAKAKKIIESKEPVSTADTLKKVGFSPVRQEKIEVSGIVKDSLGSILSQVSVLVKGRPKAGTVSDKNGRYILEINSGETLIFRSVGFVSQEFADVSDGKLNVTLKAESQNIDEVQVVAYGIQKKSSVVGSVTSVKPSDLKVPSSNLTTAFAGRIAGMIAYQRSGEPGKDNAQFFIRGITTFGVNNVPLILIDNIELTANDLARMQVDDIESFSVLKDASATALYGARGANGVILVTTKQGKEGKAKINFRAENTMSQPTRNIALADPITYMKLYREGQLTRGDLSERYTLSQIDHTLAGDNPYVYPNVNWQKLLLKQTAINQRANGSVSGGGGVAQYYVSGSVNRDNGILNVPKVNSYNNNIRLNTYLLRSNVNINLGPSTKMVVRLSGTFDDYNGPIDGGEGVYNKILKASPTAFPAFYAADSANIHTKHILFGNSGDGASFINPYADMVRGYRESSSSRMLAQLEFSQNLDAITKGLSFRAIGSTNRYAYFELVRSTVPYFYNIGMWDPYTNQYTLELLNRDKGPTEYLNFYPTVRVATAQIYGLAAFDYARTFGKHTVSGSLIGTIEESQNPSAWELSLALPHRNLGISGRATYNFDNRYFTEFNFGYNGSERFYKDKQFGFFPTIGAGWMVSNEKFWKDLAPTITKLKLRGSYGLVGNDAIGTADQRFFYLSSVNMNDGGMGASFGYNNGAYAKPGISIAAYGNNQITWETSKQLNLAMEIGAWNKLNLVAEYWQQNRSNILMKRASIPTTMGLSAFTYANVGAAQSKGVDLTMDYATNIGTDFSLSLRGNLTYATSKFSIYEEPEYLNAPYLSHVGRSLSQNWGYIAERLFIDDKDVLNSPKQNFGTYGAGDIKYTDVNGDGQITKLDQVPLGLPTSPEIVYGFGFSATYKQFDISAFAQGLARESFWIDPRATAPFVNNASDATGENALLQAYADNHWSEENRNLYALWPRLGTTHEANNNNYQTSSWFMRDGSFLRLKSVEFGYTLPKRIVNKLKMENLRFYMNGTNLLTFSGFKLWDVEMGGYGLGYPVQRVFNLGININF